MWQHMSELQTNFKPPTYTVVDRALTPVDKEQVGSMMHMDPPCPMSTWGMMKALRGLPGPFMMGSTSLETSLHFQAYVTGPVSSTRL